MYITDNFALAFLNIFYERILSLNKKSSSIYNPFNDFSYVRRSGKVSQNFSFGGGGCYSLNFFKSIKDNVTPINNFFNNVLNDKDNFNLFMKLLSIASSSIGGISKITNIKLFFKVMYKLQQKYPDKVIKVLIPLNVDNLKDYIYSKYYSGDSRLVNLGVPAFKYCYSWIFEGINFSVMKNIYDFISISGFPLYIFDLFYPSNNRKFFLIDKNISSCSSIYPYCCYGSLLSYLPKPALFCYNNNLFPILYNKEI